MILKVVRKFFHRVRAVRQSRERAESDSRLLEKSFKDAMPQAASNHP